MRAVVCPFHGSRRDPLRKPERTYLWMLSPTSYSSCWVKTRLAPLPVTSHHLLSDTYPAPTPRRSYPQLMRLCRDLLLKEWDKRSPDLARYLYKPSLSPDPFMGLNKFDAGRLPQTRSGKSYLRAHPAWDDDRPTTCPRCSEAPETLEYAVLYCPAREPARHRHLLGVSDFGPDAPLWPPASLLAALARFMRSILTAFSTGMFSCPTSAVSSVSSRSSAEVSFGYFMSSLESQ